MRREYWERFSRCRLQREPLVGDPGMQHGTCVTHVPWYISGPLKGRKIHSIPGEWATRNFAYLARGPWLWKIFLWSVMICYQCEQSTMILLAGARLTGIAITLQWRHNERDDVSNHRRFDCLFNRLFRGRSKKSSKLRVTGLRGGNTLVARAFPTQRPVTRQMFPLDDSLIMGALVNNHIHMNCGL